MLEPKSIRFGEFEVEREAWIIRRNNTRVALQKKPFQILRLLLSRPGELVSRHELARELWPDLHVSYDRCLNTAVHELRRALDDPTRRSRYIETRPGLGYRFIGSIEGEVKRQDEGEADLTMGYYFLHRFSSESLTRARACFHAALKHRGDEAQGHAALAQLESLAAVCGHAATREAADRALQHADAAMRCAGGACEARVAIAAASALSRGVYDAAMKECQEVLEAAPACLEAYLWSAEFLCASGQAEAAVRHLRNALRLNPASLLVRSKLSLALYLAGDYRAAVEQAWPALSMEPACSAAQLALALAYEQLGYLEDAVTEFGNAVQCSASNAAALAGLCHALYGAGRQTEARRVAAELAEASRTTYVSGCWQALAQLASGDREAAELSAQRAADAGDCLVGLTRHDPRFRAAGLRWERSRSGAVGA